MYSRIELDPKRKKNFTRHKHPWVFSGAIVKKPKDLENGSIVSVYCENDFIMHGYYNAESQIAIRALSWQETQKIDLKFFLQKIRQAILMRQKFVLSEQTTACRLIFAESDFLPGFIVDKYNHSYIVQIHTLGAEKLKTLFCQALVQVCTDIFGKKPAMIMEKTDLSSRQHEGMEAKHQELLFGKAITEETILENGHQFLVNLESGQKTGFFLDQRDNRQAIAKYAKDRRVLNLFAYTGGFSVYAAQAGCTHLESVDISKPATDLITKNLKLNNCTVTHHEATADAFNYLTDLKADQFDLIIIDPPSFIKSAKKLQEGMKGYLTLNQIALEKLSEDGLLVTSSCSAALDDISFFRMLNWAANAAKCQIQVIEKRSQPTDHPLTPYFPEGEYLKFYIVRKVKI